MKRIKQSENVCKNFIAFSKKICMVITLLLVFIAFQSKASVQLMVVGSSNVPSINTGNQFIYTLNYQVSSLTTNGQNVVATMALPQNLEPFDVSNFSNSVSFSSSQVSSVTYNPVTNTITVTFVNPIPAGSTGQLQIKFKYINETTPNNYAPDLVTSIDAANNVNLPDSSTGPVLSNVINVTALAANNFTVGKVLSSGGAINDISIFKINIGSSSSGSGALILNNPTIVDTLPIGTTYIEATAFSGTSGPVYDNIHRTITWTFTTSQLATNYSSSAYVVVKYNSPTYSIGSSACNTAYMSGSIPVLPIGTYASSTKSGNVCFNIQTPTPGAACSGGGISAATASWLNKHILAGTTCNSFGNGWFNSGNTELDSVTLTYDVDKNINMNVIKVNQMFDGLGRKSQAEVLVRYATNLNGFVTQGTYDSTSIGGGLSLTISLPSGEYITQVNFTITGHLPIGATQSFSYCGDARTAAQGAKDGSAITEGTTYLPSNLGDDGTVVTNNSSGNYYYNGTTFSYSNCSGSAEILIAQPVFNTPTKSIRNASSNFNGGDTIIYRFSVQLGGNVNATNVELFDTLDNKLTYITGSSTFGTNGGNTSNTPITPAVNGNALYWNLGTLTPGSTYYVFLRARIKPGTVAGSIPNKMKFNSSNALMPNGQTTSTSIATVISSAALRAYKGQSGCDPNFVYYPSVALAQEGGAVNYKISLINQGNVGAKDLVLVDVFPFIGDIRGSEWFANLVGPVTISDPNSTVYYSIINNPCYTDFTPAFNPSGCSAPNWSTTPPIDITKVKAIKITRSSIIAPLDSIVLTWPMRAPVGVPINKLMNNSIMYQIKRADDNSQLLPTTPIMVGMKTSCLPILGSIGNYVWIDANKNGLQDEASNMGLNGLKVYLYGAGPNNAIGGGDDILLDSTISSNDFFGNPGYYKFVELASGKYYVNFQTNYSFFVQSPVVNQGSQTDGNNDAELGTGNSGLVTINASGAGQDKDNTTIDAGFYVIGSLGNYIWFDDNKNGLQDEPASFGINGEKVYLYKDNGSSYVLFDSTHTANDTNGNPGYYNFVIDQIGNYKVKFPTSVSTKILTTANGTAGINGNSDANAGTGFSPVIVMDLINGGIGRINPTIDAGYKCNVSTPVISGNVNLCPGQTTTLTSTAAYAYQWYHNGIAILGATNPNYVLDSAGVYIVVTSDVGGCKSDSSLGVTISLSPEPKAYFDINNPSQCSINNSFVLTNNSIQSQGTFSTLWNFGDASTSNLFTPPAKNYTATGNFVIKLLIYNVYGCKDSLSKSVFVGNPTASFTYTKKCGGIVEFINTSINATDYEWIFGNGSYCTNSTSTFSRVFNPGNGNVSSTYTVTLIARNNGRCSDTIRHSFTIDPNPIAVFNADGIGCTKTVKFNNFSLNGNTYEWDFGILPLGTALSASASPTHTYAVDGSYNVRLITKNLQGCPDTLLKTVIVNSTGTAPIASFAYSLNSGTCVKNFTFNSTSINAVSLQWIFSDGSIVNQANVSHSFPTAGNYTVKLVAKSASNCYDTATQTLNITGNTSGAVASFSINKQKQCLAGNSFDFNNTSVFIGGGYNTSYEWDFGDGDTNTSNTFIYNKKYNAPGLYTVKLTAIGSNGCSDSYFSTIEVLPSPTATFTTITNCGMTATITNHTTNAISNIWSYGDGGFEENNDSSINHTYNDQDWYFIKLYAIGANGCIDSSENGINTTLAHIPQISLTYDTIACNNSIHFNNTTMGGSEFVWDFGDGSPLGHDYYATHAYAVAGNYVVTLTASNGSSCLSTYSFIVRAPQGWNLALPKANFNYTIAACTNLIKMNDLSTNQSSRAWYFDGNLVSNLSNDSILAATAGVHTLQLVVMNGSCSDTLSQVINIQNAPTGSFDFVASTCSKTVSFTSNMSNANLFKWHFGDAGSALDSSTGNITSHTFSSNGNYIVKLDVTNLSGCIYSMSDTINVNGGTNPLDASFNFNNSNCDCYCSNKIKFANTSNGNANSYLWNFGDGNTSTQMNPNKGYAATGNYNVSLTVSDTNGCFSIASAQVFVPATAKGPSASFTTDNTSQCLANNNFNFYNHSQYMGAGWINKYYWSFGDGTFDTTNTFVYNKKYTNVGTYSVRLIAVGNEDCRDTMLMTVQVNAGACLSAGVPMQMFDPKMNDMYTAIARGETTGVEDAKTKSQNEWTLYPNPNSGSFSVHSLNISNAFDIYLVDILGRSIDAQITINKASNSIDFVLSEARSGYYFVIINNESGDNARLKFNINE